MLDTTDGESPTRAAGWSLLIACLLTALVYAGFWNRTLPSVAPATVALAAIGGVVVGLALAVVESRAAWAPTAFGAWLLLLCGVVLGFLASGLSPAAALALVVAAWSTGVARAAVAAR
ncbi:hypothetical protein MBEHAL_1733 [Halarchaeum acidiphilum MH1-52-1]|uniref:Uncharacterized protein n=1 Tax=Halarchaeum acidiphilum MH1-52-1 TaxID=1261545 RepID=U3ADX5_9EURY|nr:hypothetical protein [Halarchaeum acidiphilum]GAD52973.1 hypothetical protein MBEHAL_1733 [Halarchaeum acidiphilum MH1-52-1]